LATTLLTITTPSGWPSSGVVIAKFSAQVVAFRSSPTVLAETPVDWSASTRIRDAPEYAAHVVTLRDFKRV
jgi:hypothetical protein